MFCNRQVLGHVSLVLSQSDSSQGLNSNLELAVEKNGFGGLNNAAMDELIKDTNGCKSLGRNVSLHDF